MPISVGAKVGAVGACVCGVGACVGAVGAAVVGDDVVGDDVVPAQTKVLYSFPFLIGLLCFSKGRVL